MKKCYSPNDLVRFLYHETTVSEDQDIAYLLEDNASANTTFHSMLEAKHLLNELPMVRPSQKVLDNILAHA